MFATKEDILKVNGHFTWFWGQDWFIETELGNFHWKDPDYGDGDNTLTLFNGSYKNFCNHMKVSFGRDKGVSSIEATCGSDFTLVIAQEI